MFSFYRVVRELQLCPIKNRSLQYLVLNVYTTLGNYPKSMKKCTILQTLPPEKKSKKGDIPSNNVSGIFTCKKGMWVVPGIRVDHALRCPLMCLCTQVYHYYIKKKIKFNLSNLINKWNSRKLWNSSFHQFWLGYYLWSLLWTANNCWKHYFMCKIIYALTLCCSTQFFSVKHHLCN